MDQKTLGASDGQPFQTFYLGVSGILPYPQILVREVEHPTPDELEGFGSELVQKEGAWWVRWREVKNILRSGPEDRHFTADLHNGVISFGDGKRGKIPPPGARILADAYRVSEGRRGNVKANTITVLESKISHVEAVKNVVPAEGGEDPESIREAMMRGPWVLKHRHRAVTEGDFQELAKSASTRVAKATCFQQNGVIHVVVLPKNQGVCPRPTNQLVQHVTEYLDRRRLITTRLKVVGPEYVAIDIEVYVVPDKLHTARFDEIKSQIAAELKRFLHPLRGGPDQRGWPIGRNVHKSELYYLLEKVEGVDHIKDIRMRKHRAAPTNGRSRK